MELFVIMGVVLAFLLFLIVVMVKRLGL